MSALRLIYGFRFTELFFCLLLITVLVAWSMPSYQAYMLNAQMIAPFYELHNARTHISIDSAYTGSAKTANKSINYSLSANQRHSSTIKAHSDDRLSATLNFPTYDFVGKDQLVGKVFTLQKVTNQQIGYLISRWPCSSSLKTPPFKSTTNAKHDLLEPRYSHFLCVGKFQ